jgi:hypothetical protein
LQALVDAGDNQSELDGADGGLGPVRYFQLGENAPHLCLYGTHAAEQVSRIPSESIASHAIALPLNLKQAYW